MHIVYIIGAGGHARSLINLLELNSYFIRGIYDTNFKRNETINGYRLLGTPKDIKKNARLVLAIGDNQKRKFCFKGFYKKLIKKNIIHPLAIIEKRVVLGECNQIFAGAYINSNVVIGNNNIINTKCVIEHEVVIGNHNHISVGTIICGRACIGDNCFIGAGAVVIDKITICDDVTVGANAVVVDNITKQGTYVGIPARRIK